MRRWIILGAERLGAVGSKLVEFLKSKLGRRLEYL